MSRSRLPALAFLAASAWHLSVFLSVALGRLTYPFEVEFLEGLTIDYAKTLAAGGNLYAPPSLHGAPNWYPPLHYLVSLPFLELAGWQLWGARLVSILSVLGAAAIGVAVLRRLGASPAAGLASLAVAFAYYPATNYWYDVARVDSLQTLLVVAGLACLSRDGARPSPRATLAGGALFAAALFTKQTSIVACLAALLYFTATRDAARRNRLFLTLLLLGLSGSALLLAVYGPDALIIYWGPQNHFRNVAAGSLRFAVFAWTMLPLAMVASEGLRGASDDPRVRAARFYFLAWVATFAMGWLTMCKHGGERNSSLPAVFVLSVCVGLGVDRLLENVTRAWRPLAIAVGLSAFLVVAFRGHHLEWIPTPADRQEAAELIADMRAVPGPFLAYNCFISTTLRGETYPYFDRLYDWAGGQNQETHFRPDPGRYPAEFMAAIRNRRFAAIYTNGSEYFDDPAFGLIVLNYVPVHVWRATIAQDDEPTRWKNVLPRVKWLPLGARAPAN